MNYDVVTRTHGVKEFDPLDIAGEVLERHISSDCLYDLIEKNRTGDDRVIGKMSIGRRVAEGKRDDRFHADFTLP